MQIRPKDNKIKSLECLDKEGFFILPSTALNLHNETGANEGRGKKNQMTKIRGFPNL